MPWVLLLNIWNSHCMCYLRCEHVAIPSCQEACHNCWPSESHSWHHEQIVFSVHMSQTHDIAGLECIVFDWGLYMRTCVCMHAHIVLMFAFRCGVTITHFPILAGWSHFHHNNNWRHLCYTVRLMVPLVMQVTMDSTHSLLSALQLIHCSHGCKNVIHRVQAWMWVTCLPDNVIQTGLQYCHAPVLD